MNSDIYKKISENAFFAIGMHQIVYDDAGVPVDYVIIEVNNSYELLTGCSVKDIIGKKITTLFPKINESGSDWITTYGDIATNGGSKEFEYFYDGVNNYYRFQVFSPKTGYFITMFHTCNHSLYDKSKHILIEDIIDFNVIQSVVDSFSKISNIAMGIGNLQGKLLLTTGFQDICKNYHRKNPSSCENCTMSDTLLFQNMVEEKPLQYKCLNNMYDISMPIQIFDEVIGALYLGQFIFEDERIDYDVFQEQAKKFGFNEAEYIKALELVPRISQEYFEDVKRFYTEFAKMIILLGYKNIDISTAALKQRELIASLEKSEMRLTSVVNSMLDAIIIYDKNFQVQYANESAFNLLGRSKEELVGKYPEQIWYEEDEQLHLNLLKEAFRSKQIRSVEIEYKSQTSEAKNLKFTYIPILNMSGYNEMLVIIHDYTLRKQEEEKIKYQNTLIGEMGKVAKIGGWEFNPKTGEGTWTDETARIHGRDPSEKIDMSTGINFFTEESKDIIVKAIQDAIQKAQPYDLELELIAQKGKRKWVRTIGQPTISNGEVVRIHGALQDISQRKKNEEQIKESEVRYSSLLDNAPIGIAVHAEGKIVFVNPAGVKMFGLDSSEQLIGRSIFDIMHPSGHEKALDRIQKVQSGEKDIYPVEDLYVRLDGTVFPVEILSTPIQYQGKPAVQVIVTDITERKKAEDNLRFLSYHDQLTGIYNRRFFEEELLKIDTEDNLPMTIVMADVNGLKLINDSFGHSFGDELLIKAAQAMQTECKSDSVLARLGGDEFVLILPKTNSAEAEEMIRRIRKIMQDAEMKSVSLSVSFGSQTKTQKDQDIQVVLADAENHMYKHKVYESNSMRSKSIEIIMNTLYEKSKRELMHSRRVSKYCEDIAKELNLDKSKIDQIKIAGLVHDIGKIGVSEKILNKVGKLNRNEWDEIRKHPEIGWRILITSNEFSEMADFVLEHQERWDGKGYPNNLKGEEISLEARIIALADAYDAMTSERTYRKAMSKDDAIVEIQEFSGKQFDPDIVNVFINKVLSNVED